MRHLLLAAILAAAACGEDQHATRLYRFDCENRLNCPGEKGRTVPGTAWCVADVFEANAKEGAICAVGGCSCTPGCTQNGLCR